jgi:hypothetical protein
MQRYRHWWQSYRQQDWHKPAAVAAAAAMEQAAKGGHRYAGCSTAGRYLGYWEGGDIGLTGGRGGQQQTDGMFVVLVGATAVGGW